MRILILGTSNSLIRDGWVSGLRESLPEAIIDNMSIGASPGIQFYTQMNKKIGNYDYVFLDSVPNDEEYFLDFLEKNSIQSQDFFFKMIEDIIIRLSKFANLVVLLISRKEFFETLSPVYKHRLEFLKKRNINYVDSRELINKIVRRQKIKYEILYKYHPSHPDVGIMNLIGRVIGSCIVEGKSDRNLNCIENKNIEIKKEFKSFPIVHYENSIINEDFFTINSKNKIILRDDFSYVGMYVNIRKTNCLLRFFDKNNFEIYKISLYYKISDRKNDILKVFIPCPSIINAKYILVDFPSSEKSDYYGIGSKDKSDSLQDITLTFSEIVLIDYPINSIDIKRFNSLNINGAIFSQFKENKHNLFYLTSDHSCSTLEKNIKFFWENVGNRSLQIHLSTYFGTVICFDLEKWELCHKKMHEIEKNDHIIPIMLNFLEKKYLKFSVNIFGVNIYVCPFKDKDFMNFDFSGMNTHISYDNFFMCALPNGTIATDRSVASNWEKFKICCLFDQNTWT